MKKFELIIILIFSCFAFAGIYHHEIWLDEAHHWLLARDSVSIPDLIYNMRYDGHPALWNILLFGVSRFTHDPIGMQILNAAISIMAVFVFLKHSPFSKLEKTLFIFGYFILYEYSVISRNYSLVLFFLFLVIVQLSKVKKNYLMLGILLALLSNTHLFAFIISVGIVVYVGTNLILQNNGDIMHGLKIGFVLFLIGAILCILQINPPTNSPFLNKYDGVISFSRINLALSSFVRAFIPISDFSSHHFWNSNFPLHYSQFLAALISIPIFFLPILLMPKKPASLLFYYFSVAGILFFVYLTGLNSVRHFGIIYILFISAIWLSKTEVPINWNKSKLINWLATIQSKYDATIILSLFIIQASAGIITYSIDVIKPFSANKEAADFIATHFKNNYELITFHAPTPGVCSYLQNKVYLLEDKEWGSYIHWERNLTMPLDEKKLLLRALDFAKKSQKKICLILYRQFEVKDPITKHFQLLKSVKSGIVKSEEFYIYSITL